MVQLRAIAAGGTAAFAAGFLLGWAIYSPAGSPVGAGAVAPDPETGAAAVGSGVARAEEHEDTPVTLVAHDPLGLVDALLYDPDAARALKEFHAVLRQLNGGEFAGVLRRLDKAPRDRTTDTFRWLLTERWARVDPTGAVASLAKGQGHQAKEMVGRTHAVWARSDPEAALASALALEDEEFRRISLEHLVSGRAAHDPAGALALLESLPEGSVNRTWARAHVFEKWARADHAAAIRAADALPAGGAHQLALRGIAQGWAAEDPQGALTWVEGLSPTEIDPGVAPSIFQAWVDADPLGAGNYVATRPGHPDHVARFIEAARRLGQARGETFTLAWVNRSGTDKTVMARARSEIVTALAQRDPAAARELLHHIQEPGQRARASIAIARTWAAQDPAKAATWAAGLTEEEGRSQALPLVFSEWGRSDGPAATAAAANLPKALSRVATLRVARAWANEEPEVALRWIEALEIGGSGASDALGGNDPKGLLTYALTRWIDGDLGAAGNFIFDELGVEGNEGVTSTYFSRLATYDPAEAANVAGRELTGADLDRVVPLIGTPWLRSDPRGLSEWLNSIEAGDGRDAVVGDLVAEIIPRDPESALEWALTIADPERRAPLVATAEAAVAGAEGGGRAADPAGFPVGVDGIHPPPDPHRGQPPGGFLE